MAWNDLTFVDCSLLTAAKMTQLQGNFAALAAGEPGAPPLRIDGISSLATVHASSGVLAPQVSSLGLLHVSSGVLAPQVSSLGSVQVASGATITGNPGSAAPAAHTLYRANVPKAWVVFNGVPAAFAVLASFNIASVTRIGGATGQFRITFQRAFASANYVAAGDIMPLRGTMFEAGHTTSYFDLHTIYNPDLVYADYPYNALVFYGEQ